MNGETYQAARIVSAARKAIFENGEFRYAPLPYENTVTFQFLPGRRFFRLRERTARDPAQWFAACRADGLREVLMLIRTESPDRRVLGFVNTKPVNITAVYQNGSVRFWTPRWEFDAGRKQWNIVYMEHVWKNAPRGLPEFTDNTESFRSILEEMERFAEMIGEDGFARTFAGARALLMGETGCPDDVPGLPELPEKNRAIFRAAMTADVFGAMGSWNDSPAVSAHEKGLDDEYERLSDELLKQMRLAAMYAVNQRTNWPSSSKTADSKTRRGE